MTSAHLESSEGGGVVGRLHGTAYGVDELYTLAVGEYQRQDGGCIGSE